MPEHQAVVGRDRRLGVRDGIAEISHHGWSKATNAPYRHLALGVIRVRDGQIVRYDDYMDPIAVARLLGRTSELAAALASAST